MFDSNGPSVRIRGNAFQVHEKYLSMARDATSSGDRIAAENYYQHAEHYFRIHSADQEERVRQQQTNSQSGDGQQRRAGGRPPRNGAQPAANGANGANGAEQPSVDAAPVEAAAPEPEVDNAEEGVLRTLQVGDPAELGTGDDASPKKNGQDTAAND